MAESTGRADIWLAQDSPDPEIVVVGVPWAEDLQGVALAPIAMRDRLERFSTFHLEREIDLSGTPVSDRGNWPVSRLTREQLIEDLSSRAGQLPRAPLTIFLGGDDAITRPLAAAEDGSRNGLIQFTAKPGRDATGPGPAGQEVVLIGAHNFAASASEKADSDVSGIGVISIGQIISEGIRMTIDRTLGKLSMSEHIHVSVDLDVLDRSHAPGAASALPGGMTARELGEAVRQCAKSGKVRSIDIVGADVNADIGGLTMDAMCYVFLSAATGYAER